MRFLVLASILLLAVPVQAQTSVSLPSSSGDQLLFFFDARTNRVPFLTVANPGETEVAVEVALYPQDLGELLGLVVLTIAPQGNVIVNPAQEAGGVADGLAGLAVVTPVLDGVPIIPPQPIVGSYTLANTALQAGFGGNSMGRRGVLANGAFAPPGAEVDGNRVRYQRLAPRVLMVPTYYNPTTLDPPEDDGNRVILVSFVDDYRPQFDEQQGYRPQFRLLPHSVSSRVSLVDASGAVLVSREYEISAIELTNLQELAGDRTLDSSGKVFVDVPRLAFGNLFGIFSQSLAAFGAGARMPALDRAPPAPTPIPTPTPTPASPTPAPTPDKCGNGVLDPGEQCDGDNLDGNGCEDVVGSFFRCTGSPACNDRCELTPGTCQCDCEGDFDCDIEVDCSAFVPDCYLFGACEDGKCVTNPAGTSSLCLGSDPDYPDEPRCEEF